MNDCELIKETISDYFEGYMTKDRKDSKKHSALELPPWLHIGKMKKAIRNLLLVQYEDEIDEWVSP